MGFFDFFKRSNTTKNVAKDRLKLVLIHDRVNCSTQLLEMLKTDIIKVISNYMEVDEAGLDMQISHMALAPDEVAAPVLMANIPIKNLKRGNA